MEILTSKYNYFSPSFRTPKSSTSKAPLSFDTSTASNKENLVAAVKKEKSSVKLEEKPASIARSSSLEKKIVQTSQQYAPSKQQEPLASSSLVNFPSALVFNSPRYEPVSFFSSQDKNSYKAKYMNKPNRNSSKVEEKSTSQDQYIHSKVDKIVTSSISGKDKPKSNAGDRNSSNGAQFEEPVQKTSVYTRVTGGIAGSTPKARESNGFEHVPSKSSVQRSSVDFFKNVEKKELKITTSEPDEKPIRRETPKHVKPSEDRRVEPSKERNALGKTLTISTEETSSSNLARQPQSTKHVKTENRLSESQSLAESLSQIKKSSILGKASLKNVAIYNNFVRDDSKETKLSSPKSITPKATIKASEPKNFFQTMKVTSPKSATGVTRDSEKRTEEPVSMTPAKTGTPKTNQRTTDSAASNQRPSSSTNKDRDSAKKIEESQKVKTQPQNSLKGFVTQVNPGFTILKNKVEEKTMPIQPQSTKNSTSSKINLDSKLVTLSNTTNILKVPNTTTSAESKTFTFAKTEKPQPKASVESKAESQSSYTYYMTGLEKYLKAPNSGDEYYSKIYREHFMQTVQAINFCKYLKPVDPKELAKKKVYLPKRESHKDKKTMVFDLDETLIHCNENVNMPCDVILPIKFPHGDVIEAGINVRPYALEILEELSKYYEIIVFTASHSCYANVVLDYLDPQGKYIHHRLFRDNCVTTEEGLYIKDLRVFANRNLKDIVLVDNAAYSFGYQVDNGIPIIPFYYNKTDTELKSLIPYLKSLYTVRDVREVNNRTFKLQTIMDTENQEDIIDRLFAR